MFFHESMSPSANFFKSPKNISICPSMGPLRDGWLSKPWYGKIAKSVFLAAVEYVLVVLVGFIFAALHLQRVAWAYFFEILGTWDMWAAAAVFLAAASCCFTSRCFAFSFLFFAFFAWRSSWSMSQRSIPFMINPLFLIFGPAALLQLNLATLLFSPPSPGAFLVINML